MRPTTGRTTGPAGRLCGALALTLLLGGCAAVPAPPVEDVEAGAVPAVGPEQAQSVRADVAEGLLAAAAAGDPAAAEVRATGPALLLEQARIAAAGGGSGDGEAVEPVPADVVVSPLTDTWPRWFMTVSVPDGGSELPTLDVYDAADVREPYRLWGRLTMLPGASLPAFDATEVGSPSLSDGRGERGGADGSASDGTGASGASESESTEEDEDESADVDAVLADLATRYASVMDQGDASPHAAEFTPDVFVAAVRARAEAERAAVGDVADVGVVHAPLAGGEVLYAVRSADGDVLAVTAVTTTTEMVVRQGTGILKPGAEVAALAGIEETTGTLTVRSVAALAFVVPAERGAIQLVAVGEGLVLAEES